MIKTNELRIGNFVSINNGFEMLVHSIFQDGTVYLDFIPPLINEADVWEEDYKDLIAIQLTEEWLLKAGFKYKKYHPTTIGSADVFGSGLYVSQMINNGFSLVFQTDKKSFYFEFSDRYIKYVHELQNIYFALTGVELVFTTEP